MNKNLFDQLDETWKLYAGLCSDLNSSELIERTDSDFAARFGFVHSQDPKFVQSRNISNNNPNDHDYVTNVLRQWERSLDCYRAATDYYDGKNFTFIIKTRPDVIWYAKFPAKLLFEKSYVYQGNVLGKASRVLWTDAAPNLTSWQIDTNTCKVYRGSVQHQYFTL